MRNDSIIVATDTRCGTHVETYGCKTVELMSVDGRKSFGGKALIREFELGGHAVRMLVSYNSPILIINGDKMATSYGEYPNQTTQRHIRAFLHYCGVADADKFDCKRLVSDAWKGWVKI